MNEKLPAAMPPLRPYQREPLRAIWRSVTERQGLTFTVVIARQGGKNELSAQLEAWLLGRFGMMQADAVKCAPTFRPQLRISMRRLWARLGQSRLDVYAREREHEIAFADARILFLSAEPGANVVGHTASLLLEADEAQDIDAEKFDREFRPMAATANATTVLYGTPWDDRTLLERAKHANLEAQARDGIRRHFEYDWQVVARHVPAYAAFVEHERARLGATHPAFLTQYCLQPVAGAGRLFTAAQRAQLAGGHARRAGPDPGECYAAGLDLAGGVDDVPGGAPPSPLTGRRDATVRDATVLTVGRLVYPESGALVQEPRVEIVQHYAWTGEPHDRLLPQLTDLLRRAWRISRVSVDATGLGETTARFLAQALGASTVDGVRFTAALKSELGFGLIAAANGGRLRMYAGDGSDESAQFWRQCELARASYRANSTMAWGVDRADGHDDFLVSAALLVRASQARVRRSATGRLPP